jgi:phosphoenolpyruvate carboxylase
VQLLKEYRASSGQQAQDALQDLLLSFNCVATGLGWTG